MRFSFKVRLAQWLTLLLCAGLVLRAQQVLAQNSSLTISGYADAYYNYHSDSLPEGEMNQFETIGPRPRQFGLNFANIRADYTAERVRSSVSLFWGDVPALSWDSNFPMIQQASAGFRLAEGVWFDAGFFPTHIGTELLMPKDNLMSGLALGTYHEPFFMSGATVTAELDALTLQVVAVNSYSSFLSTTNAPGVGLLATYDFSDEAHIGYSNLITNEAPRGADTSQLRFYNNLWFVYQTDKFTFQTGADYGIQTNYIPTEDGTNLDNGSLFAAEAAFKYRFSDNWAAFTRFDYFTDRFGTWSGESPDNTQLRPVGLKAMGFTLGAEYNPLENAYVRLEGRYLNTDSNQKWFYTNGKQTNTRFGALLTIGVYFDSKNLLN